MDRNLNDDHCAFEGCYTVDFLPVTCNICQKGFCTAHSFQDVHGCSETVKSDIETNSNTRVPCSFSGCVNPTLFFIQSGVKPTPSCDNCGGIYCLAHQLQHNCVTEATTSTPKSHILAQKAIENVKAASQSSGAAGPQKNPAKAAKLREVEAMKMRRKAEPANPRDSAASVPMDQRLFVTVSNGTAEKILWVKKEESTGRALDLFAAKLGLISSSPLSLLCEGQVLRNDVPLSSQVENASKLSIEKRST